MTSNFPDDTDMKLTPNTNTTATIEINSGSSIESSSSQQHQHQNYSSQPLSLKDRESESSSSKHHQQPDHPFLPSPLPHQIPMVDRSFYDNTTERKYQLHSTNSSSGVLSSSSQPETFSGPIDRATGLPVSALSNLHKLLQHPSSEKDNGNSSIGLLTPPTTANNSRNLVLLGGSARHLDATEFAVASREEKSEAIPISTPYQPTSTGTPGPYTDVIQQPSTSSTPSLLLQPPPQPTTTTRNNTNPSPINTTESTTTTTAATSPSTPEDQITQLQTQNHKLKQAISQYQTKISSMESQLDQRKREALAYATRVEALTKQLDLEIEQRKALQNRLSQRNKGKKPFSEHFKQDDSSSSTSQVFISYIKKLEKELDQEKKASQQMFLEREDELLAKVEKQKEKFIKSKDSLLKANTKLLDANRLLLAQMKRRGGDNIGVNCGGGGGSVDYDSTNIPKLNHNSTHWKEDTYEFCKELQKEVKDILSKDTLMELPSFSSILDVAKDLIGKMKKKLSEEKEEGQRLYLEREDELLNQIAEHKNLYKRKLADFKKKTKVLNRLLLEKEVKDFDDDEDSEEEDSSGSNGSGGGKRMRI